MLKRRFRSMLFVLLVCMGLLAGCGDSSPARTLSPADIARFVGAHYGDPDAKVVDARSDVSEGSEHEPMYSMTISGHFHKDSLQAVNISFSALADKMYPWSIMAFDQAGEQVWQDMEIVPHPK